MNNHPHLDSDENLNPHLPPDLAKVSADLDALAQADRASMPASLAQRVALATLGELAAGSDTVITRITHAWWSGAARVRIAAGLLIAAGACVAIWSSTRTNPPTPTPGPIAKAPEKMIESPVLDDVELSEAEEELALVFARGDGLVGSSLDELRARADSLDDALLDPWSDSGSTGG
jgi:hypothetical protein